MTAAAYHVLLGYDGAKHWIKDMKGLCGIVVVLAALVILGSGIICHSGSGIAVMSSIGAIPLLRARPGVPHHIRFQRGKFSSLQAIAVNAMGRNTLLHNGERCRGLGNVLPSSVVPFSQDAVGWDRIDPKCFRRPLTDFQTLPFGHFQTRSLEVLRAQALDKASNKAKADEKKKESEHSKSEKQEQGGTGDDQTIGGKENQNAEMGVIRRWYDEKGYGFIRPNSGSVIGMDDLFFHVRNILEWESSSMIGEPVIYVREFNKRSERYEAVDVRYDSNATLEITQKKQKKKKGKGALSEPQLGEQIMIGDVANASVTNPWTLIQTEEEFLTHLQAPLEELLASANGPRVAVDLEGLQLNFGIQLMQLGFSDHGVYTLDVAKIGHWALSESVLRRVLEDKLVVKVMHDCRQDSRALWIQYNVTLANVFDTQVVFGILHEMEERKGPLHALAGVNKVLQKYAGQTNTRKQEVAYLMNQDALLWVRRPLSYALLDYAAQDVSSLLQAFERMNASLTAAAWPVVERRCASYVSEMRDRALDYSEVIGEWDFDEPRAFSFQEHQLTILANATISPKQGSQIPLEIFGQNITIQNLHEIDLLAGILPGSFRTALEKHPFRSALAELVLDVGRPPLVRLQMPGDPFAEETLSNVSVTAEDLEFIRRSDQVSAFASDDRAGISSTLHRLAAIRNRQNELIGLTIRVGRTLLGSVARIEDIVASGRSVLLLGSPGTGKTTVLREFARQLADEFGKRVMVVDTSSEISGDGDAPHNSIGGARRMIVINRREQHQLMVQAVQNHNAECIVVDEIGDQTEVDAAATIAQRGVQLVGTAHGVSLQNLIKNPELNRLVGGVEAVILGDKVATKRGGQKVVNARREPPVFEIVIELLERNRWVIHQNVARAVDDILNGLEPLAELREVTATGEMRISKVKAGKYF